MPCGPINSVADQLHDPHFAARGVIQTAVLPDGETVTLPAVAPQLSLTPGGQAWPGPPLGAHNVDVYEGLLGLDRRTLDDLRERRII